MYLIPSLEVIRRIRRELWSGPCFTNPLCAGISQGFLSFVEWWDAYVFVSISFSTQTKDRQKSVEYVLHATAQLPTEPQFVMPNLNAELEDLSSSDMVKRKSPSLGLGLLCTAHCTEFEFFFSVLLFFLTEYVLEDLALCMCCGCWALFLIPHRFSNFCELYSWALCVLWM